ncbi:DUF1559 domain-containing protein [Paludisphaera soli]|uniref:DUF1559 domain-containing protein n=1 Tax=Paludisphaera soli TaxID=2712865 RepID=UPI0013E9FCDC|nr:DUF1559 domain-containing protein [Paludisphaera soli]
MDAGVRYETGSDHSGGVKTCMADGGVRFVKGSVNRMTWRSLGTRESDEVVSSDGS